MVKLILLFGFIMTSFCLKAQMVLKPPPKRPFTRRELKKEASGHPCLHRNKYSVKERLKFKPFDSAIKVQVVSWLDNGAHTIGSELPKINDTICYSKLEEVITLTKEQIDSLTDIMFNVGYKGPVFTIEESECFMPHNALLFINGTGKVFAYIEICFLCQGYKASSSKINIGEICTGKYGLIKKFFIRAGIKTGTIDEEP